MGARASRTLKPGSMKTGHRCQWGIGRRAVSTGATRDRCRLPGLSRWWENRVRRHLFVDLVPRLKSYEPTQGKHIRDGLRREKGYRADEEAELNHLAGLEVEGSFRMTSFSMQMDHLMTARPIPVEQVLALVESAARQRLADALPVVAGLADLSGVFDDGIADPALAAVMAWGVEGIGALKDLAVNGFSGDQAQRYLLAISAGLALVDQLPATVQAEWLAQCGIQIDERIRVAAVAAMRELLLTQASDDNVRQQLMSNLSMDLWSDRAKPAGTTTSDVFLSMLLDTRLALNRPLLEEFAILLESAPAREEDLHQFLIKHPILLDPLALEVRSKHELGAEFITDFVIKRLNDEYILVEIEKSTDRIFTLSGRLHSQLTDALSQVRDFQAWIHDNIAYARTRLPGIRRPEGLVVTGRSSQLNPRDRVRLDEENFSRRGHVRIVTFDELLDQARTVYRNLLERPVLITTAPR